MSETLNSRRSLPDIRFQPLKQEKNTVDTMPTFITEEQFSCGHSFEIFHQRTGDDEYVITETLPVPIRCLSCICQELLDSSVDGIPYISRRRAAELHMHFKVLRRGGMYGQLQMVKYQVLEPSNVDEFRAGVLGLAGFPEIKARFVAAW